MSSTRGTQALWISHALPESRSARRAIGVVLFAVATALGARLSVPVPGTPVFFTFQPLMAVLAGALLGARLGAASQALYLAAGMVGLPVFVAGGGAAYLLGPSGGYLMAYPLAAFVAGALAGERPWRAAGSLLAGMAVIYAGGLAWLTALGSVDSALVLGLRPFLAADLVKVALGAAVVVAARRRSLDLFTR